MTFPNFRTKFALVLLALPLLFFGSCKKYQLNKETTTSRDFILAENIFTDVFRAVDEAARFNLNYLGQKSGNATCENITITEYNGGYPKTMTIDFGATNCADLYDVNRRGKIEAVFSGPYTTGGSVITVNLMDFHLNDNKGEGTTRITVLGNNNAGEMEFRVEVINGTITTYRGDVSTFVSNRLFTQIEGQSGNPTYVWDDVYRVTGRDEGYNRDERSYTTIIDKPLKKAVICQMYQDGEIILQPQGLKERRITYSQDCHNRVLVTIGKKEYDVPLYN